MSDTKKPGSDLLELLLAVNAIHDKIRNLVADADHDGAIGEAAEALRCEGCSRCFRCEGCSRCEGCFRCFRCEGCFRCFRCEGCRR